MSQQKNFAEYVGIWMDTIFMKRANGQMIHTPYVYMTSCSPLSYLIDPSKSYRYFMPLGHWMKVKIIDWHQTVESKGD